MLYILYNCKGAEGCYGVALLFLVLKYSKFEVENRLTNFKYNRWLLVFILIGLAAALVVSWQRHKVEEKNMSVEMALDYEDVVKLAQIEGVPVDTTMEKLREAGIGSLAVYETTLEKLSESGRATAIPGASLLNSYQSGMLTEPGWRALVESGQVRLEEIYIVANDAHTFGELEEDLTRRLGEERVRVLESGPRMVIAAKANFEKAVKWNLGLSREELQTVNDQGFLIVARPSNYQAVTEEDVKAVFARLAGFNVSDVVFSGDEVLGYPSQIGQTAAYMKERNLTLGLIEHPQQLQFFKQEGLIELARKNDFKAARVYSIPKDEQPKMKIAAAVERWALTDQERNVRINLLRPFEKTQDGMSLLDTNLTYISRVKEALEAKGFQVERAGTYQTFYPERLFFCLIALGATAAGVLYLSLVFPLKEKYQYLLLIVITAALCFPLLFAKGGLARSAIALASANLFPSLAMIWVMDRWRSRRLNGQASLMKIVVTGAALLFVTGALSFIGGFYVASVLADMEYLLEIHIFRGVKLTFVLPILLVSIAYLRRFPLFDGPEYQGDLWGQVKKALNYPVYVKSLIFMGIAAVGALIFIGRSGHTMGIPVPAAELKLRAFLEQAFYARPRSKELFIGHPAFMLAVMAVYRRWPNFVFYVLVVLATIGQGSMVETFAHLRTPVFMSLMRGLGGLVLGAGLGAAAIMAAHVLYSLSSFVGRGTPKDE